MHTYVIMQNPGHSRVYYEESAKLALAELKIACQRFENGYHSVDTLRLSGLQYLAVTLESKITADELQILSRLSFLFALFELIEVNSESCLVPITTSNNDYIDPKITSLLKYSGKTNELFTKMMVNIALLSSRFNYEEKINLLDPIAGKGTTLFEGAVYGFDVAGIELNTKAVHEACIFFKKYLEREKYKHNLTKRKVAGKIKSTVSIKQEFEYAATKEAFKQEDSRKKLHFAGGNSTDANLFFKKNSFHLLVGDLPYGVAHGNVSKSKTVSLTRNPAELLAHCLPEWYKVLKTDGVLVLAWNKFVLNRKDLASILQENDFTVFTESPYDEFEHRVDQSIKRDIIVARK